MLSFRFRVQLNFLEVFIFEEETGKNPEEFREIINMSVIGKTLVLYERIVPSSSRISFIQFFLIYVVRNC